MFFYEEVVLGTISAPTPVKTWDLGGYSDFNLIVRAQGPAGAYYSLGIGYNAMTVLSEEHYIGVSGLEVLLLTYRMYGPLVSLSVHTHHPIHFRFRLYAACCGENPGILFRWPISFNRTQGRSLKELPDITDFMNFRDATRGPDT